VWPWPLLSSSFTEVVTTITFRYDLVKLSLCLTNWATEGAWGSRCMFSSMYSWPRHWLEVSGQLHAPVDLPSGKSLRYPLDTRLGVLQNISGRRREENNLAPTGTRTRTLGFQPITSRCIDCATTFLQICLEFWARVQAIFALPLFERRPAVAHPYLPLRQLLQVRTSRLVRPTVHFKSQNL
jgi:hypothetical protein